jgi:hypothetical protein
VRHKTQAPDQPAEDERLSVVKYLNEFDIKDVIDIGNGATDFKYESALEHKLSHNILNGFRRDLPDQAN